MSEFQAYVTFDEQGAEELMRLPALDDAPMLEVAGAEGGLLFKLEVYFTLGTELPLNFLLTVKA
jgi:hypothetical protein